ncbi:WD-repeat membrane protein, putative [Eimeria maxima]|uniref:WD-repeat membrane protein, putative n=1 Tax=Eimeria maxima TaxID=5804 RepID=U6M3F1_EIMMA|nr:WD-repeat membrane protein, putative [Eimeria maxima]CDJ56225.1 WD-repeat membrane protein, putative [Eimeria maxima]
MITNGSDNALIEWIFDSPDGIPRELKARRGNIGTITHMEFYGTDAKQLLVATSHNGRGFVGFTSLIQQQQNCVFSQKNFKTLVQNGSLSVRKLKGIVSMSCSSVRHFDWPAVVTAHEQTPHVFIWSAHKKALEPRVLAPPGVTTSAAAAAAAAATSVCCSTCGNFVVVGYADGRMHKYNLQSGLHRGEFFRSNTSSSSSSSSSKKQQQQQEKAHKGPICGINKPLLHKTPRKPIVLERAAAAAAAAAGGAAAALGASLAAAAAAEDDEEGGGEEGEEEEEGEEGEEEEAAAAAALQQYKSTNSPLALGALTLSGVSAARMHAILYVDEIKEQTAPSKAPEPLPDAPFFIPSRYEENSAAAAAAAAAGAAEAAAEGGGAAGGKEGIKEEKEINKKNKYKTQLQKLLATKGKSEEKYKTVALSMGELGPLVDGTEEEVNIGDVTFLSLSSFIKR